MRTIPGSLRLLAIAESRALRSFSRKGRLTTPVPEEGEPISAGQKSRASKSPGSPKTHPTSSATDLAGPGPRPHARLEEIEKLRAQFASVAADERRIGRLVKRASRDGEPEALQHQREALAADIRARESERQLDAEEQSLRVRLKRSASSRRKAFCVLSRRAPCSRATAVRASGSSRAQAVVTLQIEAPTCGPKFPKRDSSFTVGARDRVAAGPAQRPLPRPASPRSSRARSSPAAKTGASRAAICRRSPCASSR